MNYGFGVGYYSSPKSYFESGDIQWLSGLSYHKAKNEYNVSNWSSDDFYNYGAGVAEYNTYALFGGVKYSNPALDYIVSLKLPYLDITQIRPISNIIPNLEDLLKRDARINPHLNIFTSLKNTKSFHFNFGFSFGIYPRNEYYAAMTVQAGLAYKF